MDPGYSHLQNLKKVPNLIDEDPSIVTPAQQKGYMNMPWKEFAAMMQKRKETAEKLDKLNAKQDDSSNKSMTSSTSGTPAVEEGDNEGAWDAETGYQDENHASYRQ